MLESIQLVSVMEIFDLESRYFKNLDTMLKFIELCLFLSIWLRILSHESQYLECIYRVIKIYSGKKSRN